MRVLALTGVPGTGKTTIAGHLGDEITVVDANELAHRLDAVEGTDEDRQAELVDEARLGEQAHQALPDEGLVVVEGHLSHHCDPDAVILLRCHPSELADRLDERGWPPAKVEENRMAETLDALVPEIGRPARELDTTELDPEQAAAILEQILAEGSLDVEGLDELGTADWTGDLAEELP